MRLLRMTLTILAMAAGILAVPAESHAQEFVVYGMYRPLDLGNPGEAPQKDYYINMGSAQGLRQGAVVEVNRRMATYDLQAEKLYKDLVFPIARLKVIHVEANAAVARMEKMLPPQETPGISPATVMVGDLVRSGPGK
jgi:hypothetical protein